MKVFTTNSPFSVRASHAVRAELVEAWAALPFDKLRANGGVGGTSFDKLSQNGK